MYTVCLGSKRYNVGEIVVHHVKASSPESACAKAIRANSGMRYATARRER